MVTLTPEEIKRRSPVWDELSMLFVGKELEEYDYERIARILYESKYSKQEIDSILLNEVSPVFRANLYSIPEMEGWSSESVAEEIVSYLNDQSLSKRLFERPLVNKILMPKVAKYRWDIVCSKLQKK